MKNAEEHLMTVFSAALDCATASERDGYLNKACADSPDLRARVEALLRAHGRSVDFLPERPIEPAMTAAFRSPSSFAAATSSGRALEEELRRLLRSRLILVHLLWLGYV